MDENTPETAVITPPVCTFSGGRGNKSTFDKLNLKDLASSKNSFGAVIKQYAAGEMSEHQARALCYLFTNYLSYLKEETTADLIKRLEVLEAKNDKK